MEQLPTNRIAIYAGNNAGAVHAWRCMNEAVELTNGRNKSPKQANLNIYENVLVRICLRGTLHTCFNCRGAGSGWATEPVANNISPQLLIALAGNLEISPEREKAHNPNPRSSRRPSANCRRRRRCPQPDNRCRRGHGPSTKATKSLVREGVPTPAVPPGTTTESGVGRGAGPCANDGRGGPSKHKPLGGAKL